MHRRERAARALLGAAAVLGVVLCTGLASAGRPAQKSIRDGVFTAKQVEAGKEVFESVCSDCHTTDVFGPDYMVGWTGATVGELFAMLQGTMPYENPGMLEDEQYAAVLGYLFFLNGVEAGEEALPTDVNKLYEINIEGPFTWKGLEH